MLCIPPVAGRGFNDHDTSQPRVWPSNETSLKRSGWAQTRLERASGGKPLRRAPSNPTRSSAWSSMRNIRGIRRPAGTILPDCGAYTEFGRGVSNSNCKNLMESDWFADCLHCRSISTRPKTHSFISVFSQSDECFSIAILTNWLLVLTPAL
jgi:hypothetical protein